MLRVEDCRPGVVVECIDVSPSLWPGDVHGLVLGAIYTIKRTSFCRDPYGVMDVGVDLVECHADGWVFDRGRFRLLPDCRLAVFREMLQPVGVGA